MTKIFRERSFIGTQVSGLIEKRPYRLKLNLGKISGHPNWKESTISGKSGGTWVNSSGGDISDCLADKDFNQ